MLFPLLVFIGYRCAEENLVGCGTSRRIHHFGRINSFTQKTNASIDFTQAALAVKVITVFTSVAVARSPRNNVGDLGPLYTNEMLPFIQHATIALRCHVVFRAVRQGRKADILIIVVIAREIISHFLLPISNKSYINYQSEYFSLIFSCK